MGVLSVILLCVVIALQRISPGEKSTRVILNKTGLESSLACSEYMLV